MGRHGPYRPGSFYRTDDRSGFPQRAEQTKREWTNAIVDEKLWEARHPQDYVKGVKDNQTVPLPRPLAPNSFYGPLYFQVAQDAPPQSWRVILNGTAGISVGDAIGIILDDGSTFNTTVAPGDVLLDVNGAPLLDALGAPLYDSTGTAGQGIGLMAPLPQNASVNNLVVDYRVPL